jgi:hypothetical protein
MTHRALAARQEELRRLIADRLDIRARSFRGAVRKAGRLLPARARAAAADIEALETRMAHPKLAARTDPALIDDAAETFRQAMARHPAGARRAHARALLLAEIGSKLLILGALVLLVLHWRTGG